MSKPAPPNLEPEEQQSDEVIGRMLTVSLGILAVAGIMGGIALWWSMRSPEVVYSNDAAPVKIATPAPVSADVPSMPFADATESSGINYVHHNGAAGEKLLPETMGGGCAFFDHDNDGDQDLLLVDSGTSDEANKPFTLFANDGKGTFSKQELDLAATAPQYGMGVAIGDYDGDGWQDVFLTAVGKSRLFRNAEGKFEDVSEKAGVAGSDDQWGTSAGFFDYDHDGDLDLWVCHYVQWSREYDLAQDFQLVGGGRAYGRPQNFGGTHCTLFQNQGEGAFRDVSKAAGIEISNPDTNVPAGKSLGLAFADFDGDGWLDVVVANDTVANFLFHNQGDGTFKEIGYLAGIAYDTNGAARGAMGIDIAHFRNSSECGIAIGNFSNEMTALYVSQGKQVQFRDDAVSNGLGPATRLELTFGIFFFDADLDGRLDLFAANGHLEDEINRVQASQTYAQPAHFFWNCGSKQATEFVRVPKDRSGEALLQPMVGRGTAYADIDGDGDLDIVEVACGGEARLLRNDQTLKNHWLRLKLVGKSPNTAQIGAEVELHSKGEVQRRLVGPTKSYLSQCELPVTFGLGTADKYDKLVIRWPSGKSQTLENLAVDQQHEIREE